MDIFPASSTFLAQNFAEFYRELLIQKEIALRTLDPDNYPDSQKGTSLEQQSVTESIQHKLRSLFEKFSLDAQNQIGEFAASHFQEALYVMVSLADEVFLSFAWLGQKYWESNLLESQFFHTQVAGELVYKKLDALIESNDPMRNDLAIIYLMALALGFKGQYRGENDDGKLIWYRHQLYALATRRHPVLFHPGKDHLIESCYDHTIATDPGRGLPDLRTWFISFGTVLLVYMFISSVLWYKVVRDLDTTIGHVLTQAQRLGLS